MKKVIISLAASLAVMLTCSAGVSVAIDRDLPLQQQLDNFADSLMRPGTFVMQGYMNPDCGNILKFAVTGLFKNETHSVTTDSAGRFSATIPMVGPIQEIYLYRNNVITLPVYPGDTINLDIEKNSVRMSGATPEATRDLEFATLIYDRFRQRINNFARQRMNIPQESLMKSYPDSLTQPLIDEAVAISREWRALQDSVENAGGPLRSSWYYKYSCYVEPQTYLLMENFYKHVNTEAPFLTRPFPGYAPYSFIHPEFMVYPPVKELFNRVISKTVWEAGKTITMVSFLNKDENLSVREARLRRLIARDEFLADWLDLNEFGHIVKYMDWDRADGYRNYIMETVKEPAFKPYIDSIAAELDKARPGTPAPPISLIGTDGRKYTLDDFKGKIVYLDFWMVGCGPCYSEFRSLPELKEAYKDYLDKIEFVTVICNDPSKEVWLDLISKHKLDHELNTMLDVEGSNSLYNINSFPTYILIDAEGRLVKYGAPRPSVILSLKKYGSPDNDLDKALGI